MTTTLFLTPVSCSGSLVLLLFLAGLAENAESGFGAEGGTKLMILALMGYS